MTQAYKVVKVYPEKDAEGAYGGQKVVIAPVGGAGKKVSVEDLLKKGK